MIYNGKERSIELQNSLRQRVGQFPSVPILAIISASKHPSVQSFVSIKRKFAEATGVSMKEITLSETTSQETIIAAMQQVTQEGEIHGLVVQLPLPEHIDTEAVLNTIPKDLDVDVLGASSTTDFRANRGLIPPVACAVEHILTDTHTDLENKKVVVVGQGRLVGLPVTQWFVNHGITPAIVDISTSESKRLTLYNEADIVISGIGVPHHLKPEYFKHGAVLIDAGTSEQFGKLAGDFHPDCVNIARVFTPVPGGVGPMTVAGLFENLLTNYTSINK
jgi:methylenetetrahydrofolate dehydrogenase (NADP+)/methenyltetrahydrofolate cyclohydrolase